MIWLIAIGSLALGIIIGALASAYLGGTPARIKELESQVKSLEERHDQYKEDVSEHFNVTADLIQQMTQSYRDVYQHLATGAQDLCTADVANKLLPVGTDAVFDISGTREGALGFTPPKDYAAKESPDQKGALAEDFGLAKAQPDDGAESTSETESADEESDVAGNESEWKASEADDDDTSGQEEAGSADDQSEDMAGAESAETAESPESADVEQDEDTITDDGDEITSDEESATPEGSVDDETKPEESDEKKSS